MVFEIPAACLSRNMETKNASRTELCPGDVFWCLYVVLINFTAVVIKLITPQWYLLLRACFVQATGTNSDLHLQGHGCHDPHFTDTYMSVQEGMCSRICVLSSDRNQIIGGRYSRILSTQPFCDLFWILCLRTLSHTDNLSSVLSLSYGHKLPCSLSLVWSSPFPSPDCLVGITACIFQLLWGVSYHSTKLHWS